MKYNINPTVKVVQTREEMHNSFMNMLHDIAYGGPQAPYIPLSISVNRFVKKT